MNSTFRYILAGLGVILAGLTLWYFFSIVAYILLSAVLALMGRPLVDLLGKIRIRKIRIPKSVRAVITLAIMWFMIGLFFWIFIPLVAREAQSLSTINPNEIMQSLEEPTAKLEEFIEKFNVSGKEKFSVENFLNEKAISIFNLSFFSNLIGSFAGIIGNIFIAIFSITFITFFFLRDEHLFASGVLTLVPDKHAEAFKHAMSSTRYLLMRYFLGILGQITAIFLLLTLGLTIAGVGFTHSILIALIAALFNVIPYVGPLIGIVLGLLLGLATHLDMEFYTELVPLAGWMLLVFIIVQLMDNFLFQPLIFSNSVNAHPLEIFILLLVAGSLAGIAGMILAIPCYTILRVFAKEFFNKFSVVKKLTKNIR
ncbi:MAG: AI-2E family transporter [Bacteroidales bacterium]|nr:AI-2E family transporter [Bacteroidales bacterium]